MTTLFDILVETGRALDALIAGVATSGSATTIADTQLPLTGWDQNDAFKGGTAFILQTTDAAAPVGLSRQITAYTGATGVSTFATLGATVDAGDRYGLLSDRYPREQLVTKLNEALASMGDVPTVNTSLTTAAATLKYAVPLAAKRDLRQVWIAHATAEPYGWEQLTAWRMDWAAPGAAPDLVFPYQPLSGYKLMLVYMAAHGAVYADTDQVNDYLGTDWPAVETALRAARWRLTAKGSDEKKLTPQINDLMTRAARASLHRGKWPKATPKLAYFPGA